MSATCSAEWHFEEGLERSAIQKQKDVGSAEWHFEEGLEHPRPIADM
ncbi:MAG TPA: hypothetical protein PKA63_08605 [Oligoflexia bacterium]|nr:hypothetical protein [Oligoflexia bacterium]